MLGSLTEYENMSNANDILVDNVKEAFRRIEKLAVVSLASSVWLLAVSEVNPTLADDKLVPKLDILPNLGADLPTVVLALLALFAYFASGVLIASYYRGSAKVTEQLRHKNPELSQAVKTFPSIVTLPSVLRLVAFLALGGLGMIAIILIYRAPEHFWRGFWAAIIIGSPYIILFLTAFWDAVSERIQEQNSDGA